MTEWLLAVIIVCVIGVSYIFGVILHSNWKYGQFKNTLLKDLMDSVRPKPKQSNEITPKVKIAKYKQVIENSSNKTARVDLEEYKEVIERSRKKPD